MLGREGRKDILRVADEQNLEPGSRPDCWKTMRVVTKSLTAHMIKKIGSKYVVFSETTKRKFGSYKTKKEAVKRLRQMEFFKHLKSSPFLKRKLRKKSLMK